MSELLWISFSCGFGALIRYSFTFINGRAAIPVGTLLGNLVASFLIGYFSQHIKDSTHYTILASGFLGGLGTYSTLNFEFIRLFKTKKYFLIYFTLTYLLGLVLVFLGIWI